MKENKKFLVLMDYDNRKVTTPINLECLDTVKEIWISVVSGDEIANIELLDGIELVFDSGKGRLIDFFDGNYLLYSKEDNTNRIDEFLRRKDSYTIISKDLEEEWRWDNG